MGDEPVRAEGRPVVAAEVDEGLVLREETGVVAEYEADPVIVVPATRSPPTLSTALVCSSPVPSM